MLKDFTITDQELLKLANRQMGTCLCGHRERCSVCDRSQIDRELERVAKLAALELLMYRGWEIEEVDDAPEGWVYRNIRYVLKEPK